MLLIRHVVLHPDGLRHGNVEVRRDSKVGRQGFYHFRQYRALSRCRPMVRTGSCNSAGQYHVYKHDAVVDAAEMASGVIDVSDDLQITG